MMARRKMRFWASSSAEVVDLVDLIEEAGDVGGQILDDRDGKDDAGEEDPQAGVDEEG